MEDGTNRMVCREAVTQGTLSTNPVEVVINLYNFKDRTKFVLNGSVFGFEPIQSNHLKEQMGKLKYLISTCSNQFNSQNFKKNTITSLGNEIEKLAEMYSKGILSDEEFKKAKSKLLNYNDNILHTNEFANKQVEHLNSGIVQPSIQAKQSITKISMPMDGICNNTFEDKQNIFCVSCGNILKENDNFCIKCGFKVELNNSFSEEQKTWNKKNISIQSLDILKTPESNGEIILSLKNGTVVSFLDQANEETKTKIIWYKIKYKDIEGWCNSKNIKKIPSSEDEVSYIIETSSQEVQETLEVNKNNSERSRHGFATFWFIFYPLSFSITWGVFTILIKDLLYVFVIVSVVSVVACSLLLSWKKIGVWIIVGLAIILLIININNEMGIWFIIIGLIGIAIMLGVLFLRKNGKTIWEQLE